MRRNLTTDPHFSTPARLAPALPPIPGSEASSPPTPTPSQRSFIPSRTPPQSLGVAVERLTRTPPQSPDTTSSVSKVSSESGYVSAPESVKPKITVKASVKIGTPPAPVRPIPSTPTKGPTIGGKEIGRPVLNIGTSCAVSWRAVMSDLNRLFADATLQLSPVKARTMRTPILIDAPSLSVTARTVKTLSTGCVPHYRVTSLTPCLISCP